MKLLGFVTITVFLLVSLSQCQLSKESAKIIDSNEENLGKSTKNLEIKNTIVSDSVNTNEKYEYLNSEHQSISKFNEKKSEITMVNSNEPPTAERKISDGGSSNRKQKPYNILAVFPYQGKSHSMVFHPMLKILLEQGYNVTLVTSVPMKGDFKHLKQIINTPTISSWTDMFVFEEMVSQSGWSARYDLEKLSESFMFPLYGLEEFTQLLSGKDQFDLILCEPFFMQEPIIFLGHIFKCPVVAVSTGPPNTNQDHAMGRVRNPALEAEWTTCATEPVMNFNQRALNTLSWLLNIIEYRLYYLPKRENDMRAFLNYSGIESIPPITELIQKISLNFVNSHHIMNHPTAAPPNMISLPGLHIQQNPILPKEFEEIMSNANDGVILFAMGTMVPVSKMKEERAIFINTFARLRQLVLWKSDIDIPGLPQNIKLFKWLPQQAILAHENCKVFITHGGMLGKQEAVYHGVPLLSIPLFGDQQENAGHSQASGLGITLQYYDINEDNLFAAINAVIYDKQYSERLTKLSKIFKQDVVQSENKLLYWVNHVIEFDGASYLRRDSTQLYWFQYYLLDVITTLIFLTVITMALLVKCAQGLYRLRFPGKPEEKKKKE